MFIVLPATPVTSVPRVAASNRLEPEVNVSTVTMELPAVPAINAVMMQRSPMKAAATALALTIVPDEYSVPKAPERLMAATRFTFVMARVAPMTTFELPTAGPLASMVTNV